MAKYIDRHPFTLTCAGDADYDRGNGPIAHSGRLCTIVATAQNTSGKWWHTVTFDDGYTDCAWDEELTLTKVKVKTHTLRKVGSVAGLILVAVAAGIGESSGNAPARRPSQPSQPGGTMPGGRDHGSGQGYHGAGYVERYYQTEG